MFQTVVNHSVIAPRPDAQILVLGWYNRNNLGDDCYVQAFQTLFTNVTFACTDDVQAIPAGTDVVICGGGDIIHPFFMKQIRTLLQDFNGPCYAVSVGTPFTNDAQLMSTFDHVFVRSSTDYNNAIAVLPEVNVSRTPDLSWTLVQTYAPTLPAGVRPRVGVCLAQPMFHNAAPGVTTAMIELIDTLCQTYDVHLLAFNTFVANAQECDYVINDIVTHALSSRVHAGQLFNVKSTPNRDAMMAYISSMDVMLCMRYHAIQYSLQARKAFAAIYTTKKVNSLLSDVGFVDYGYQLPVDSHYKPVSLDVTTTLELLTKARAEQNVLTAPMTVDVQALYDIVNSRKRGVVRFRANVDDTEAVVVQAGDYVSNLLGVSTNKDAVEDVTAWVHGTPGLHVDDLIARYNPGVDRDRVAATLCFAATHRVSSKYVWGMAANLGQRDFNVSGAIDWVVKDVNEKSQAVDVQPPPGTIDVSIDMNYFLQDDFKDFHRSGWSYCLTGLLRLDTRLTGRRPWIMVDGYTDRTFMWGCSPLRAAGIVPYQKPWMGFVHHTFNSTFGANNCFAMFQNPLFIQSLDSCKCLVVLSQYLAAQMRSALDAVGAQHVSVEVLYHPMEQVPNVFTMEKFYNNMARMVVNVGAWLRDPYSIYELPLYDTWQNPFNVHKAILRGKDMESSAAPEWLMPFLDGTLQFATMEPTADPGICRPTANPVICRPTADPVICRPGGDAGICRPSDGPSIPSNHYLAGMVAMLDRQSKSVQVLEKLSNDAYDDLLAANIVFLNLVDASACNTVMECLMRGTPLLVNRHPAVEEILGSDYPGFYENLSHAASMLADGKLIAAMNAHMMHIAKDPFTVGTFVADFQKIVTTYGSP